MKLSVICHFKQSFFPERQTGFVKGVKVCKIFIQAVMFEGDSPLPYFHRQKDNCTVNTFGPQNVFGTAANTHFYNVTGSALLTNLGIVFVF